MSVFANISDLSADRQAKQSRKVRNCDVFGLLLLWASFTPAGYSHNCEPEALVVALKVYSKRRKENRFSARLKVAPDGKPRKNFGRCFPS